MTFFDAFLAIILALMFVMVFEKGVEKGEVQGFSKAKEHFNICKSCGQMTALFGDECHHCLCERIDQSDQ